MWPMLLLTQSTVKHCGRRYSVEEHHRVSYNFFAISTLAQLHVFVQHMAYLILPLHGLVDESMHRQLQGTCW